MSNLGLAGNPGTSLNFDGAALQNQQEAEYRKEEEQQQHELRQMLTNAFDDLIDDDDILSINSEDGTDSRNVSLIRRASNDSFGKDVIQEEKLEEEAQQPEHDWNRYMFRGASGGMSVPMDPASSHPHPPPSRFDLGGVPLSRTQELPRKQPDPLRVSVESLPSIRGRRDDNVRRSREDLLDSGSLRGSREGLLDSDMNSNPSVRGSRDLLDSDYHSNAEDTTTKQSDFQGNVYPLQEDHHTKAQGRAEGHGANLKFVNKDVNIPDKEHSDEVPRDFKDGDSLLQQSYEEFGNLQQQQAYAQQYYGVHGNAADAQGQQRPEFQGHQTWNVDGQNAEQPYDQNMLQHQLPQHQGQYFQGHDPNAGHHHGYDPHYNHHHHFRKIYEGRPYHTIGLREETEGGNVNYHHLQQQQQQQQQQGYYGEALPQQGAPAPDANYGAEYPNTYTNQTNRGLFSPSNTPDTQVPQQHVQHSENHQGHPTDPNKDYHQRQPNESHRNVKNTDVSDSHPKPPAENDFNNPLSPKRVNLRSEFEQGYKVGYQRDRDDKTKDVKPDSKPRSDESIEKDFMKQGGTSEGQQLAQLQILYKARGRKVEELTNEMEVLQNGSAREIRILKHQMSVAKGEKEGAGKSLDNCQDILAEAKSENAQLVGRVHAAESQIEGLKKGKDDLIKKLQTAESSIETLNQHMEELGSSDSLQRARHDHDVVVAGLQQKYETEIKVLNEQIDKQANGLQEQASEIVKLKQSLTESVKTSENAQISRAETINRLTQSLEESQKRCRNLLESSSSHDMSQMKIHLQQAMASRTISDEMCSSLQDEIKDLKEQLQMMESATTLGVFSQTQSTTAFHGQDDSMVDLGIKKTLDFNTPQSTPVINRSHTHSRSNVSGDVVSSLKSELERCLLSNRQKRQQVLELKSEVTAVKKEMLECKQRCDRAELLSHEQKRRITELEGCLPGDTNAIENRLHKDVNNLKKEKKILLEDIEELQQRLQEVSRSEEKLTDLNRELSTQIANMVQEYDLDKRQALERAQRAYDQVTETSRGSLRQELTLQFDMERSSIITKYETECHKIKDQLREAEAEVDRVKELYVTLCTEKDNLKNSLDTEWQGKLDIKVKEVKEEAEKEHNLSALRLVEDFEKRHEEDLEKLKQDLDKQNEEIQNNKLTDLRTELKTENDEKNEEIKRLEEVNKKRENDKNVEIDNLKEESRKINEKLTLELENIKDETKRQLLDKEEEFELLKEMIKNSEDRVKALEVEKCNLTASILEKNKEIGKLKEQLDREMGEGKKQIVNTLKKQYDLEIKAIQDKLESEKQTVVKLKELHAKEVREIQNKETGHVTSLLVQHESEIELVKEKLKLDSETNIVRLQENFEDEIKTIKDIFEIEKSNEIAKLNKDRSNEVEKLRHEIQNFEADKAAVIDKLKNERTTEIDALRTLEISKYKVEIDSLKGDVDRVNKEKKEAMDRAREKQAEIEKLGQSLGKEKERVRVEMAEELRQEMEEDMKKTLETKVAMSKVVWLEEHRATRQTAIDNAVRLAEAELRSRMDQDVEIKVDKKLEENQLQWHSESLSQLQNERENWEALKEEELKTRIEEEHTQWRQTELANELEAERQKCSNDFEERLEFEKDSWKVVELETEKLNWTLDWEQKLKTEKDTWVRNILEPAKQKWRLESDERLRLEKDNWRCLELEPEKLNLMKEFEDRVKREKQTWMRRELPVELDKEKAKLEKMMSERLRQERENWRTTELPRHLESERRKWGEHVEEKMREERKNWKNSDLPEEIEKERKKWMKLMEATLAKERDKWRNHDLPAELDKEKQKWDEKVNVMLETRLVDKLTAEKDKLQKDSEMKVLEAIEEHQEACKIELKHQIVKEKERLAFKTESEIQERYAAEKKIWKEMVDQELNQKLDIEREKWKQLSESDIQKKLESEKERLRSYMTADLDNQLHNTAEKLHQNLEIEYEEKLCKEIEKHKYELNEEWKEKYDHLKNRLEHEAHERLEMEQDMLRSRSEHELDVWRSRSEHELNRKLESEEGNWKKQFEKELNLKLQKEELKWKEMIESDIQTRLQHERDKWTIQKNTECEKRVEEERRACEMKKVLEWDRRLDEEQEKWRQRWDVDGKGAESQLTEKVSAIMKDDLDREMEKFRSEMEDEYHRRLQHEVSLALEDAREDWHREHTMEMSINVTSAEASQGLLREEMESLKQRNDSLQSELLKREEEWIKEKQNLLSQKDGERRRAITDVQEQNESEYKQFIMEHQNTLEQALKATREQHIKEKLELEQRFSEEMKAGQSREHNLKDQLHDSVNSTKDQSDALMELDKERISWFEERDRLLQDISDRDALLGKADVHLSKEVDKLRNELQAAYQRRLDTELSSWKQKLEVEYNRVNNADQKEKLQLQKQLSEVSNELNKLKSQSKEEVEQYQEEIKRLTNQLNESVKQGVGLEKVEADLRRAKELCKEFQELAVEHQEKCHKYKQEAEDTHTRLSRATQNQEKLQSELHKIKEDKTTLVETVQSMETAYRKDMSSCKQKQEESAGRIAKTEKVLLDMKHKYRNELEKLRSALEAENDVAMEAMKNKMVELQKRHVATMDEMKRKHIQDKEHMTVKRPMNVNPGSAKELPEKDGSTHGEAEEDIDEAVLELRTQYLDTVTKIKDDVLRHITETNVRAAETVKHEMAKERTSTFQQIKEFYKDNVRQILETEIIGSNLESKLLAVEEALETLSSAPTSRSTTPKSDDFVLDSDRSTKPHTRSTPRDSSRDAGISPKGSRQVSFTSAKDVSIDRSRTLVNAVAKDRSILSSERYEHVYSDDPRSPKSRMVAKSQRDMNVSLRDHDVRVAEWDYDPAQKDVDTRSSQNRLLLAKSPRGDSGHGNRSLPLKPHESSNVTVRERTHDRDGYYDHSEVEDRRDSRHRRRFTTVDKKKSRVAISSRDVHSGRYMRPAGADPASFRSKSVAPSYAAQMASTPSLYRPSSVPDLTEDKDLKLWNETNNDTYRYTSLRDTLRMGTNLRRNNSKSESDLRIAEQSGFTQLQEYDSINLDLSTGSLSSCDTLSLVGQTKTRDAGEVLMATPKRHKSRRYKTLDSFPIRDNTGEYRTTTRDDYRSNTRTPHRTTADDVNSSFQPSNRDDINMSFQPTLKDDYATPSQSTPKERRNLPLIQFRHGKMQNLQRERVISSKSPHHDEPPPSKDQATTDRHYRPLSVSSAVHMDF